MPAAAQLPASEASPQARNSPLGDFSPATNDNLNGISYLAPESWWGNDSMHARYYNPLLGRFLSFDPIGGNPHGPQSWNRYAYVLGNPMKYIDPQGLSPVPLFSPQLEYLIWAYATSDKITVTATPLTLDYLLHGAAMFGGYGSYLQAGFRDAGNRIAEATSRFLGDLDRALYGVAGEVVCMQLPNGELDCGEVKIGMMPFGPGRVPRIHMGKQGKHILGHNNYIAGRSILRADPERLAARAGTGEPVGRIPRGQPGFKERVDFGEVIGDFVEEGVATPTTKGIITYAPDGTIHIVPVRP